MISSAGASGYMKHGAGYSLSCLAAPLEAESIIDLPIYSAHSTLQKSCYAEADHSLKRDEICMKSKVQYEATEQKKWKHDTTAGINVLTHKSSHQALWHKELIQSFHTEKLQYF